MFDLKAYLSFDTWWVFRNVRLGLAHCNASLRLDLINYSNEVMKIRVEYPWVYGKAKAVLLRAVMGLFVTRK